MCRNRWRDSVGIALPAEEIPKREMLDDWEFRENFRIIHFNHTLVAY